MSNEALNASKVGGTADGMAQGSPSPEWLGFQVLCAETVPESKVMLEEAGEANEATACVFPGSPLFWPL
jgi:hypothetical protein